MSLSLTRGIAVQQRLPAGCAAFLAQQCCCCAASLRATTAPSCYACRVLLMRGRTAKTMRHLCESRSEADPRTRAVRSRGGKYIVA